MMTRTIAHRRHSHRAALSARRAFTFIELVIVIAVVGLIGAMAGGPVVSNLASMRARGAAARIVADVNYAQRWAMSTRNRTWLEFNSTFTTYTLYVENPANPGKANRVALARPLDGATGAITINDPPFSGVTVSAVNINGGRQIEFDSFGKPYDNSSAALTAAGTITLSSSVTITIRPVTGLTEVSG